MGSKGLGATALEVWERAVLRQVLLAEPDAAVATQLAGVTVLERERLGPALLIRLRAPDGSFPGTRGAVFGGHTFAQLDGCSARAAFTVHLDDQGWVSHLFAFLEDDSPWPQSTDGIEVFNSKAQA
jgi:hypothetical protein